MECVESVSLLSLPDDSSVASSGDPAHTESKESVRRFSPRYGNNIN